METSDSGSPLTARAKFKFEGTNNDELSFDKNDIITITQQQDGGWWEGTHGGLTGWFPCAYVNLITEKDKLMRSRSVPNTTAKELVGALNQPDYRADVLIDYTKHEKEYIDNMTRTISSILLPIGKSGLVNANDYDLLVGNFEEIYTLQRTLLETVENEKQLELTKQKVGGIFMKSAGEIRNALSKYAENHPKAVEVIKEKQKGLEKILIENERDYKDLVSGLSEPLRHIDKYHTMLQELERIVPENHPDRGDLQRSASVFRETKDICEQVRKQKEAQLDFLALSKVEKIVPFPERGTILYVGVASVDINGANSIDRFIALFTKYIMFFEVTTNMAYSIKEKYPVSGFILRKKDVDEFVIEKPGTEIKFNLTSSAGELDRWVSAFTKAENVSIGTSLQRKPSKGPLENEYALISKPPLPQAPAEIVTRRRSSKLQEDSFNGLKFDHELEMILPEGMTLPSSSRNSRNPPENFQFAHLPTYFLGGNNHKKRNENGFKMRKDAAKEEEHDFEILRIIEAFCADTSDLIEENGSSFYVSHENYQPQVIVADEEKILVEEKIGDEVVFQEKSIVDAVYSIKDQLSMLQNEFEKLSKTVEHEQKARRRLEHTLPKITGISSPDGSLSMSRKEINSME
ncbi:unnamed protein product [Caenorhabditis angaria]|uniref:Uncharacterized protein n=1 Tax=Caenorhabditis angaria TaxID=860376 RepID=A0A9P1IY34_9PELO|nr:unnamed protein product [Caenorhabditis angaria]